MGNYTSAGHLTKVSPRVRREMAAFAAKALAASGVPSSELAWADAKEPAPWTVLIALVERARAVAAIALDACAGKKPSATAFAGAQRDGRKISAKGTKLVGAVGWNLAHDALHVGSDLLNTTAGDLWEAGLPTKRLPKNDAFERPLRLALTYFGDLERARPAELKWNEKHFALLVDELDELLASLRAATKRLGQA